MNLCNFLIISFITLSSPQILFAQTQISLGNDIVEMETAFSPATKTIVAAAMVRHFGGSSVSIYRSTDMGATWSYIYSISPNYAPINYPQNTDIPDPVIAADSLGNFYIVVMRVGYAPNSSEVFSNLELYRNHH